MKTAKIELEVSELLAVMWAIETATEHHDPNLIELEDDARAVHHRLQAAWLEIK